MGYQFSLYLLLCELLVCYYMLPIYQYNILISSIYTFGDIKSYRSDFMIVMLLGTVLDLNFGSSSRELPDFCRSSACRFVIAVLQSSSNEFSNESFVILLWSSAEFCEEAWLRRSKSNEPALPFHHLIWSGSHHLQHGNVLGCAGKYASIESQD